LIDGGDMNILCVIPARGGSKGLKNKNIMSFLGKPLIGYTIDAAKESKIVNEIVVSTDDAKIARVVRQYGVEIINRPKKFATDTSPIELSLRHAVNYLAKKRGYTADIIVWLQANIPIRKAGQIDNVVNKLIKSNADSAATMHRVGSFPQWMKKRDKRGYLIPFMRNGKLYRRQDLEPLYLIDGSIVAMRKKVLMETESLKGVHVFMGKKVLGIVQEKKFTIEIDDRDSFGLAEFYLRRHILEKRIRK